MKIIHRSNYIVYIDNRRIDDVVVRWATQTSLTPDQTSASITLFNSPYMDDWKAYLSKVKIFVENPFTGKFLMVFEGDITSRSSNERRSNSDLITFQCKGFHHWLDVKVPMAINATDEMNPLQRFIYQAQNIDIEKVRSLVTSNAEVMMKDNNIQGIIDQLFEKITAGYYEVAKENTNFFFTKVKERFKVMCDVNKDFRESGFLDLFTFHKASFIDSFLSYFVEVVEQLMMEFYQDRDGTFKVKFPSWDEPVLKQHVLDASVVEEISSMSQWEAEPTRVLAVGSATQLQQALDNRGITSGNMLTQLTIPVGLYIGNPAIPESEEYYSARLQYQNQVASTATNESTSSVEGGGDGNVVAITQGTDGVAHSWAPPERYNRPETISCAEWYDDLGSFAPKTQSRAYEHFSYKPRKGEKPPRAEHYGRDYSTKYNHLYNIGTKGVVVRTKSIGYTAGNTLAIEQVIDGVVYGFAYLHLHKKPDLKVGQNVYPGMYIGQSGATGAQYSTGNRGGKVPPHLHFEVWKGGYYRSDLPGDYPQQAKQRTIDPFLFLKKMKERYKNQPKVAPGPGVFNGQVTAVNNSVSTTASMQSTDGTQSISTQNVGTATPTTTSTSVAGGVITNAQYIDANTVPAFNKAKAWKGSVPKEADLVITANYFKGGPEVFDSKFKGKLKGIGKDFIRLSAQYGIDPGFVAAIVAQETGWGTSVGGNNNISGMMYTDSNGNSRKISYPSIGAGLEATYKNLTKLYLSIGLITPRLIQAKYAPYPAKNDPKGLNKFWIGGTVSIWMDFLGGTPTSGTSFSGSTSASANASTTGSGVGIITTSTGFQRMDDFLSKSRNKGKTASKIEMGYNVMNPATYSNSTKGVVPAFAKAYQSHFDAQAVKISPKLLISLVEHTSKWDINYKTATRSGLMAYPTKMGEVLPTVTIDSEIARGAQRLRESIDDMDGSIVLGVAAYLYGNSESMKARMKALGAKSFTDLLTKETVVNDYVKTTQQIIESFISPAEYLKDNFHKNFEGRYILDSDGKVKLISDNHELVEVYTPSNIDIGETNKEDGTEYIPRLSAEEKMYKVNLVQVDQELIRMDSQFLSANTLSPTAAAGSTSNIISGSSTDTNSMTLLVNKQNKLPSDYVPSDLTTLRSDIPKKSEAATKLRKEAAEAFQSLYDTAKNNNILLGAFSGYRSYSDQEAAFNKHQDESISARPGYSEHQTGLAIDVVAAGDVTKDSTSVLVSSFGGTKEGKWLKENAHTFGFIVRYEEGKTDITGYSYEPWHLRYVGVENAKKLKENNLTLEEAFGSGTTTTTTPTSVTTGTSSDTKAASEGKTNDYVMLPTRMRNTTMGITQQIERTLSVTRNTTTNLESDVNGGTTPTTEVISQAAKVVEVKETPDYAASVDALIFKYAKYNMQVLRAMAHSVTVPLALCLPHLRVGYNMWLEPTRRNVVFYCTSVSHNGAFGSGAKTNVSGAFVRNPDTYLDVDSSIFVGDRNADSSVFGTPLDEKAMNEVKTSLAAMHQQEVTAEAHRIPTLSKLYSLPNDKEADITYSTKWNSEKTAAEIAEMVAEEYKDCSPVIKKKCDETNMVFEKSHDFFVRLLHKQIK